MNELINIATSTGKYNENPITLTSDEVVVYLVNGLSIVKCADKKVWVDGLLTYTIKIINRGPLPYETPVITDYIDPLLATLVNGTITIDDIAADPSQYSFESGTLKITLDSIAPNSETVVKFKVEQI